MSNQPATKRREKVSLGNSHMQLSGKVTSQESEAQRSSFALLGEGGTVTQTGAATDAVSLDARHGVVTTINNTLAANAASTFVVNNKYVSASSVVLVSLQNGGGGHAIAHVSAVADDSFSVTITNKHAADALDAASKIHFVVLGVAPDQTP